MSLAFSQQGSSLGAHHTLTMMLCRLWQRRTLPLLSQSGASASWVWPTGSLLLWPQRATAGPSLCSSCARTTRSLPARVCLGSLPMHSNNPVCALVGIGVMRHTAIGPCHTVWVFCAPAYICVGGGPMADMTISFLVERASNSKTDYKIQTYLRRLCMKLS